MKIKKAGESECSVKKQIFKKIKTGNQAEVPPFAAKKKHFTPLSSTMT